MAGDFSPTPHSKLMYNEAFRANQYVAAGIKPIYKINDMFQVRTELYGFLPIFPIKRNAQNQAYYGKSFSRLSVPGGSLCRMPPALSVPYPPTLNHYSSPNVNGTWDLASDGNCSTTGSLSERGRIVPTSLHLPQQRA